MSKKCTAVFWAVIMIFCLTACGQIGKITDEITWNLATVQSVENNGAIVAYDPNISLAENTYAAKIKMSLSAEDGKLDVKDETNDKIYKGTYTLTDSTFQSSVYKVTLDGKEGTAVLSDTKYSNGTSVRTLILSLGDYTFNFQADNVKSQN